MDQVIECYDYLISLQERRIERFAAMRGVQTMQGDDGVPERIALSDAYDKLRQYKKDKEEYERKTSV